MYAMQPMLQLILNSLKPTRIMIALRLIKLIRPVLPMLRMFFWASRAMLKASPALTLNRSIFWPP